MRTIGKNILVRVEKRESHLIMDNGTHDVGVVILRDLSSLEAGEMVYFGESYTVLPKSLFEDEDEGMYLLMEEDNVRLVLSSPGEDPNVVS